MSEKPSQAGRRIQVQGLPSGESGRLGLNDRGTGDVCVRTEEGYA